MGNDKPLKTNVNWSDWHVWLRIYSNRNIQKIWRGARAMPMQIFLVAADFEHLSAAISSLLRSFKMQKFYTALPSSLVAAAFRKSNAAPGIECRQFSPKNMQIHYVVEFMTCRTRFASVNCSKSNWEKLSPWCQLFVYIFLDVWKMTAVCLNFLIKITAVCLHFRKKWWLSENFHYST